MVSEEVENQPKEPERVVENLPQESENEVEPNFIVTESGNRQTSNPGEINGNVDIMMEGTDKIHEHNTVELREPEN